MSETPNSIPDSEIRPKLLELDKLAEARVKDPSTPSVVFIPAIHGQKLTPEILEQFSDSNIDFWNTQILQYGYPDLSAYTEELAQAIKNNPDIPSEENLYLVGYSAGVVLAANAGAALGLSPEKVLLIAPAYKAGMFRRERARAVLKRMRNMLTRNGDSGNEPGLAYMRRVLSHTATSLHGGEKRASRLPGLQKFRELWAWNKVQNGSQLKKDHIPVGTIFSGKNDIISPPNKHSIVGVYAGHGFKDFVPVVTQYIKTRSK